jgi:NAD(P)-dependent dehydrogenase (short-subunit alcohol dehydrogenase family)
VTVEGQVVVITGAGQGIGRAYAERFGNEGATVQVVDINSELARTTAAAVVERGGHAEAICADVTSEQEMAAAMESVHRRHGKIHTVINNAALYGDQEMGDESIAYLQRMLQVNLIGTLVASRAVFKYMRESGGGSIINIASTAAHECGAYDFLTPGSANREIATIPSFSYKLSKSGVVALTKYMAGALGRYRIRVNCISPGLTMSDSTRRIIDEDFVATFAAHSALQASVLPADLTGTAVYLASDDSALVTGQVIVVDGGYIMLS